MIRVLRFIAVPVLCLALFAAGCSTVSSDTDSGATTTTAGAASQSTTPTTAPTEATTTTIDGDGSEDVPTLAAIRQERGIAVMTVDPSGGPSGPYPVLSWQAVPEAATYWLVVSDSDGQPYWAWTGAATEVRFGGGDSAEVNQTATLYEPMTWTVIAIDSDGELVAFSEPATIAP